MKKNFSFYFSTEFFGLGIKPWSKMQLTNKILQLNQMGIDCTPKFFKKRCIDYWSDIGSPEPVAVLRNKSCASSMSMDLLSGMI